MREKPATIIDLTGADIIDLTDAEIEARYQEALRAVRRRQLTAEEAWARKRLPVDDEWPLPWPDPRP